ncbi:unnamed protein product [Vitrella brassicaformis CCMP3155]|uniref:Uncharacterized protein n=1 Tax=Vitrella brassicaformis (strain CCMP3155) TaxID=1169540 RepID=A0A0G4GQ45_VITBC|nr:unnamed protein product [Vitrella brassicaformis CCMP3155]|eukprot:CEM32501.1 unnamed protein product [Vitrella brassicaformis CCMP3155]
MLIYRCSLQPLGVPLLAYKDLPAPFPTMASKYLHAPPSRQSTRQRDMLRDAAKNTHTHARHCPLHISAIDGRAEELPIQLPSLWTYIDHLTPGWLEDQRVKYGERGVGSGGERETPGSTGAKGGRTETVERNAYRILDRKLQDLDRKFWKSRNMTHLVGWGGATTGLLMKATGRETNV